MAKYKVSMIDKQAATHVRIVEAVSPEAAAKTAMEITGWTCTATELVSRTESPAAPPSAPPVASRLRSETRSKRADMWQSDRVIDFFTFRTLISPLVVRAAFVVVTVGCALAVLGAPLIYYSEFSSANESRVRQIASLKKRIAEIDDAIRAVTPLVQEEKEREAERDKFKQKPNFQIALNEAEERLAQTRAAIRAKLVRFNVTSLPMLEASANDVAAQLRAVGPVAIPSPLSAISTALGAVVIWLMVRLALELAYALVFIHEQLRQISEHTRKL
jgi:hypothetical protein